MARNVCELPPVQTRQAHVADHQIQTLINSSNAVFRAFAAQNQNLSSSVAKLPSTLNQTQQTLTKVQSFSPLLAATLCNTNPTAAQNGNCTQNSGNSRP